MGEHTHTHTHTRYSTTTTTTTHKPQVEQEQHNDNGRLLFAASQDDHIYCYGLDSGRLEDRVCVGGGEAAGSPTSLAVSQGRTLAVGSESGTIRMYQVDAHAGAGGTFLSRDADTALMEHQGAVVGLSWGDAGSNLLASCGGDSLLVCDDTFSSASTLSFPPHRCSTHAATTSGR